MKYNDIFDENNCMKSSPSGSTTEWLYTGSTGVRDVWVTVTIPVSGNVLNSDVGISPTNSDSTPYRYVPAPDNSSVVEDDDTSSDDG